MHNIDADMYRAMDWALAVIKKIQKEAREGNKIISDARWPVIVMRTYKGWTGIKELHGKHIENTWRAHQVIFIYFKYKFFYCDYYLLYNLLILF